MIQPTWVAKAAVLPFAGQPGVVDVVGVVDAVDAVDVGDAYCYSCTSLALDCLYGG